MRKHAIQIPSRNARLQVALSLLMQGAEDAAECGVDLWEFAVEIDRLQACGVTNNDLRRFIQQGLIEHRVEVRSLQEKARCFRSVANLCFCKRSCFVLAAGGTASANALKENGDTHSGEINGQALAPGICFVPCWDPELRQLTVGGAMVKEFRQPSSRQVAVLSAFQTQGWPPRIEDPFATDSGNISGLLHFTIQNLNRNQLRRLIHFYGDGTRRGVCWRLSTE